MVPGRIQSIAELSYEFVASTIRSNAGKEGMKFFPLVFTLFMFILVANIIGLIPYTFTVTSHIIITAALALLVFVTVLVYGFYKNGLGFFRLFVPQGIPIYILPLIVFIEVLSFLSRPISHSVRLFANMLAGHITLKVFASFITLLGGLGIAGIAGATLPLAMVVALTALELLVAFLQAYVFAILTCIYLNDAIHPGH
jgi:F-type H+-transporting ATPase subunit a